jgi:hypothetical protein
MERYVLYIIKRRKANLIGNILRRNCLLKYVIEGKIEGRIEMTRRRRRKQPLDDLKEKRRYCKLEEEALDRIFKALKPHRKLWANYIYN